MSRDEAEPLPDDWEERDTWRSWWLAHAAIGDAVKAGEREMPEIFRAREGRE